MTVDFFGDGGRGLYTSRTLDLMMREARRMGVTRVYWQYLGDLERDRYGAGTDMLRTPWAKYGPRTLAAIGEPLEAAVGAAHRRGLEIFGVLKPYHTGMSATFPEGAPESDPATPMRRNGGSLQCFNPFMERIWRDPRFAGFDLYEFFHLARATPGGRRLVPVQDRMRRIRRKARELGLTGN